jgi:hypothetical protein
MILFPAGACPQIIFGSRFSFFFRVHIFFRRCFDSRPATACWMLPEMSEDSRSSSCQRGFVDWETTPRVKRASVEIVKFKRLLVYFPFTAWKDSLALLIPRVNQLSE